MLFKISLKNIRKSFRDYAIYFFTLILGVAIFYVFNAIDSQSVMLDVSQSTYEIIKLMNSILSAVSIFVSCILGFLIIYASRFLMKRRNREFGIYLTLGMSKRKISAILFFETLLIGVISLFVGLLLGVILSQFMSILVANMFAANMTAFRFIFSVEACAKTLIYFAIMYLLVMIFNTVIISRCKLIDLLQAGKKTEKVTMKNPFVCTVVFAAGVAILAYAYRMVTKDVDAVFTLNYIWVPILMGSVATFLIFWSVSGFLIKIFTSMKGVYYKGVNSFVLRQFCSKINTTVFSTTIICLMLFITISVLSAALSMKNSLSRDLEECCPVDVQFYKYSEAAVAEKFEHADSLTKEDAALMEDSRISIEETLQRLGIDTKQILTEVTPYRVYDVGLTEEDTLGTLADEIEEEFPNFMFDSHAEVMTIEDYNRIAALYGKETYELKEDEYMIVADYGAMIQVRNEALQKGVPIVMNGKMYQPKYRECKDGFVEIAAQRINDGIILVPASAVKENQVERTALIANYNADGKEEKYAIEDKLQEALAGVSYKTSYIRYNTKLDIAESSIGLGAMVTFIALYLGMIFLISSAAILALKELSDSADNKERYGMIRKIGVDERMIDRALFKQIGIFFAFPLILALIHSIFGIKFINILLSFMGMSSMMVSIGATLVFVAAIYGGYFLITYFCSRRMIKD